MAQRYISQKTYDDVVRENIEEFSMTPEEAVNDAIKQFEVQGIDLSTIIKDLALSSNPNDKTIPEMIKKLQNSRKKDDILNELRNIYKECNKALGYRVLLGQQGAYDVLINILDKSENDLEIILQCLKTITLLMTDQPDLLNEKGIELMMHHLETQIDPEIQSVILKWMKECCIKHEMNRQNIFNAEVLNHLQIILNHDSANLLIDVCALLRALVLDDDIRVEFGKAHEHAKAIASNTLHTLIELLKKYKTNEELVTELISTLSSVVVRNEFCIAVDQAGGVDFILQTLSDFLRNQKIVRQALKFLKVLAGNDECKVHIVQKGAAPLIARVMSEHERNVQTTIFGLSCIAALCLRSPANSKEFFEAGIPVIIVNAMNSHRANVTIHKISCWAIRNMVARSKQFAVAFLELGIEEIIKEDLIKFKECEFDLKFALSELGCKVELKEEWTGKGGKLNTQENNDELNQFM